MSNWSSDSWESFDAKQQPPYREEEAKNAKKVSKEISTFPTIVSFDEVDLLRNQLKEVESGDSFILQGGDCAETFSGFSERTLKNYFRLFLQMNVALMYGSKKPIVKIGRIAGQYAKPRSSDVEVVDGKEYISYRGDIVNSIEADDRNPDPERMKSAYFHSAATKNYLSLLASSGYGSLSNIAKWNKEFLEVCQTPSERFNECIDGIVSCFDFVKSCRLRDYNDFNSASFFVSHEALLLNYDSAFVRKNSENGKNYCLSGHQLWIGDRTRSLDNAHIEFCRGIENPIGIKVGPTTDVDELLKILDKINPNNESGKIILIIRMGSSKFLELAPPIMKKVKASGKNVIWQSDPMHGNVIKASNNYKTRKFDDIASELSQFFATCKDIGVFPGGIHVEITGNDVTECLGGSQKITENDLSKSYHTYCDPRLNSLQALELAFVVSDMLEKGV